MWLVGVEHLQSILLVEKQIYNAWRTLRDLYYTIMIIISFFTDSMIVQRHHGCSIWGSVQLAKLILEENYLGNVGILGRG